MVERVRTHYRSNRIRLTTTRRRLRDNGALQYEYLSWRMALSITLTR